MSLIKTLQTYNKQINNGVVSNQSLQQQINTNVNALKVAVFDQVDVSTLDLLQTISNITNIQIKATNDPTINQLSLKKIVNLEKRLIAKYIRQNNIFETFSGLSTTRPEIIMLLTYLPVFQKALTSSTKNDVFTELGTYIDAKFNIQQISQQDLTTYVDSLTNDTQNNDLYNKIATQKTNFNESMSKIQTTAQFLLTLIKLFNNIKHNFDLRSYVHNVTYNVNYLFNNLSILDTNNVSSIFGFAQQFVTTSLLEQMVNYGYSRSAIQNNFISTKVFAQTLLEYKNILENYSIKLFDQSTTERAIDTNATTLLDPKRLNYNSISFSDVIIFVNTLTTNDLTSITPLTLDDVLFTVQKNLMQLFAKLSFSNINNSTDRLLLKTLFLSKEFNFSKGLSKQETKQSLLSTFDYAVAQQNTNVFNVIFGDYYVSVLQSTNTNNLRSLAYTSIDDTTNILNFETTYLQDTNTTFEPGTQYFIDDILNDISSTSFNTTRVQGFNNKLKRFVSSLDNIAKSMNWFGNKEPGTDKILSSASNLFSYIHDKFIENNELKQDYKTDLMQSILLLASNNLYIESLLFILCVMQMFSSVDQVVIQQIIDKITQHIFYSSKIIKSTTDNNVGNTLTYASIQELLTTSSPLWSMVRITMNEIYATLISNNVIIAHKSIYSGVTDGGILMLVFDVIVTLFEKYSTQQIDFSTTHQTTTLDMFVNIVSHDVISTFDETTINAKFDIEQNQIISSYTALVGTLQSLQIQIQSFIDFLKLKSTTNNITTLTTIIPQIKSDPTFIKTLFLEQQMQINITTILDLLYRVNNRHTNSGVSSKTDINVISLLNDSSIDEITRSYFNTLFASDTFVSDNNRNILTFGLPIGFVETIQQQTNILSQTKISNKQNDIIKINVYKEDLQHVDILFKPLTFLFELSRFPVRNSDFFVKLPNNATSKDVILSFPTRDILQNTNTNNDVIYYGQLTSQINKLFNNSSVNSKATQQLAMSTNEYSFLTADEKQEILINHVVSYMLELYIKATTDLNVGDYNFAINANELRTTINNDLVQSLVKQKLQAIIAPSMTSQQTSIEFLLAKMSSTQLNQVLSELNKINKLCNTPSTLTDNNDLTLSMFTPKQFDRVFSVLIDSNDFEIDIEKIIAFPSGETTINNYIKSGEIVVSDKPINKLQATIIPKKSTSSLQQQNKVFYRQKTKNRNQGDVVCEKYYVSVETYSGANVV